jgi:peptidyl-prolyl cis-trans isomerase SurA
VAVVGATPILYSELLEEVNMRRSAGLQIPADSAAREKLYHDVINDMVGAELLVQRAKEEKVEVDEDQITKSVDDQIKQVRTQYPSETEYRTALRANGLGTPDEYRKRLLDTFRRNRLQQEYLQKLRRDDKLTGSPVSDQELEEAYQQNVGRLPKREATVSIRQIIVAPKPTAKARTAALAKADSIEVELAKGADFAQIAKHESQDPGSAPQGGDLGWNRRGTMLKEFDDMMFALPVGRVSPVVKTAYGYHIIKVDRAQPSEVKARHILISPKVDTADQTRARVEADSVRAALARGADFDSLVTRHHDPLENVNLPDFNRAELPAAYAAAIGNAGTGALIGPFPIDDPRTGLKKYVVLRITNAVSAGDYPVSEVKARLRESVSDAKSYRKLIDQLRKATYVDIRI